MRLHRSGCYALLTMVAALVSAAYTKAQTATSGLFTSQQAAAGRTAYIARCAACHGTELGGRGDAPSLSGKGFASAWGAKSTREFYQFVASSMPVGAPGSLTETQYRDIAAYIFAANGAPAGQAPYSRTTDVRIGSFATGGPPQPIEGNLPPAEAPASTSLSPTPFPLGQTVRETVANYVDVTDEMLRHPADGDWLMYRRNYQGWSYSPLGQITPANVAQLQLVWSWTMVDGGASEPTPIVHAGVMFLTNPSNTLQALDARTGDLIWEHRLGPISRMAYGANRSIAIYKDKVYFGTTDAMLVALDARTGKLVWRTKIADEPKGNTGGVMVIHGKVLTGMTFCDSYSTTGCFISAYDADTGKREWLFHTAARAGEPGGDSWNGLPNEFRAGTDTWIAGTYDPDLNTTYWGVAQAKPWFRASRRTGNAKALYSSSTLALDPDTGRLKWYFQHIAGESLDLDEVFERVLIDHNSQKTAMTIGKSGILWKLDRVSGKFLDLKQLMFQNVYKSVDRKTGRLTYRDDIEQQKIGQFLGVCPGPEGGKDWQAMSYYQPADLLIIPLSQSCAMMRGNEADQKIGGGGIAASQSFYFMPNTDENMGKLAAINAATMEEAWSWQQRAPFLTAILTSAGGVGFVGDYDRYWKAFDVKTGKLLWQIRLGQTVQGHPISFAIDGKQYVAVTTGTGGGSPQQKPAAMLKEVHRPIEGTGQQVYVFALPNVEP